MSTKVKMFTVSFSLTIFLVSCDSKSIFDTYRSLPNSWHKNNIISFNFEAPDTLNAYNMYVNLRNNNDYRYNNLFLITRLQYPNGKTFIDTLEYKMAAPDGKLLGTGFTDIKESKLWYKGYKTPFVFKENGTHTIEIQQAMRKFGNIEGIEMLEGVTEVGFKIEKN